MLEIVHISDFHYGSNDFQPEYLENIIKYINDNENKISLVVVTGDLTHKGRPKEYEEIKQYLDRIKVKILCVMGNHDARNNGIMFFEKYIGDRRSKIVLEKEDAIILGLNSARDDISEGELGDEQIDWMIHQFLANPKKIRIIALHHHLISVPYSGKQRNTLVDAGEVLEVTRLFNINLVLMGHRHVPHAWILSSGSTNTTLLYCGTSASDKTRANEPPCFNHIFLDENSVKVYVVNSTNLEKSLLLETKNGKVEFVKLRRARIDHIIQTKVFKNSD